MQIVDHGFKLEIAGTERIDRRSYKLVKFQVAAKATSVVTTLMNPAEKVAPHVVVTLGFWEVCELSGTWQAA